RLQVAFDGFVPSRAALARRPSLAAALLELQAYEHEQLYDAVLEFDAGLFAYGLGRLLETSLEALFPLGPYRRPPSRWYIFTGTSPSHVGYRGDLLPDLLLRKPRLVRQANKWLQRLEIGYRLKAKRIGTHSDLFELRLIDTRRSAPVDVALSDVGFGISQILPFVVQSLAGTRQTISIEQPEVHLHPRLQADIGELLAQAIHPSYRNQFRVETHSEPLILRLQRLVRSGPLNPADVAIVYIARGPQGASARMLGLNAQGDFVDDWPGGFFPE